MKHIIIVTALSIFSAAAFANTEVLSDIAKIGNSAALINFIETNNLQVKAVEYDFTAYCAGGPSNYIVKAPRADGKTCDVWVKVGDCVNDESREKVTLLTSVADMKCQ